MKQNNKICYDSSLMEMPNLIYIEKQKKSLKFTYNRRDPNQLLFLFFVSSFEELLAFGLHSGKKRNFIVLNLGLTSRLNQKIIIFCKWQKIFPSSNFGRNKITEIKSIKYEYRILDLLQYNILSAYSSIGLLKYFNVA